MLRTKPPIGCLPYRQPAPDNPSFQLDPPSRHLGIASLGV